MASTIDKKAIRIRPYSPEDQDQIADILAKGFNSVGDPLFRRRVKHFTTPLVIFTKSVIYTSLIQLALVAYTNVKSSTTASPLPFFVGFSLDDLLSLQEMLMTPESAQKLILQFLKPSFLLIWVSVSLICAAKTLVDIFKWSNNSNAKYIRSCFKDDLGNISGYYQSQSSADKDKKNRSQFWVACLASHPQLVMGCIALDDAWAHSGHLKKKHLSRGRSEDSFIAPEKDDAELRRLSVHQDYRRLGISKMLMASLVEHAKEQGFRRLVFVTTTYQTVAIAGYIRFGFTKAKMAKLAKFVDLWFGSMDLYATEEEKECIETSDKLDLDVEGLYRQSCIPAEDRQLVEA